MKWFNGLALALAPVVVILSGAMVASAQEEETLSRAFLMSSLEGAYLGVSLEEETEYEEGGARVTRVVDGSPADEAGIEDGDIIVLFDGEVIRGPVGLTKRIHKKEAGDTVRIVVLRDGKRETLDAELGDRSDRFELMVEPEIRLLDEFVMPDVQRQIEEGLRAYDWSVVGDCDEDDDEDCKNRFLYNYRFSWPGKVVLGVQLVEVTSELREHLGAGEDAGVLVSKVLDGTPAEKAGILVGDLIVTVEGEEISNSVELRRALHGKTGETFEIEVIRDRTPVSIEVAIPEPETDVPTGPRAHGRLPMPEFPRHAERAERAERAYAEALARVEASRERAEQARQRVLQRAERDYQRALERREREQRRRQRSLILL
jgi:membrane-associated protease RseP (regulator of RpoE activity)